MLSLCCYLGNGSFFEIPFFERYNLLISLNLVKAPPNPNGTNQHFKLIPYTSEWSWSKIMGSSRRKIHTVHLTRKTWRPSPSDTQRRTNIGRYPCGFNYYTDLNISGYQLRIGKQQWQEGGRAWLEGGERDERRDGDGCGNVFSRWCRCCCAAPSSSSSFSPHLNSHSSPYLSFSMIEHVENGRRETRFASGL